MDGLAVILLLYIPLAFMYVFRHQIPNWVVWLHELHADFTSSVSITEEQAYLLDTDEPLALPVASTHNTGRLERAQAAFDAMAASVPPGSTTAKLWGEMGLPGKVTPNSGSFLPPTVVDQAVDQQSRQVDQANKLVDQQALCRLLAQGVTQRAIAKQLHTSQNYVARHSKEC